MRRTGLLAISVAGFLLGCAGSARVAPGWEMRGRLSSGSQAHFLAAAVDDPSDEIGGLLDWQPGKPLEPPEPEPVAGERRAGGPRFGVRCALVVPGESGWKAGPRAGAYYRGQVFRVPLELGLDYAALENEDASVSSGFFYLRADVDLGGRATAGKGARFYPLAGVEIVFERAELLIREETSITYAVGLNLGLGIGAPTGRWDVRASYSWLMGSTNVGGEALVALSFGF